jgi:hypothetical protein
MAMGIANAAIVSMKIMVSNFILGSQCCSNPWPAQYGLTRNSASPVASKPSKGNTMDL